jgi:hypothetical protein
MKTITCSYRFCATDISVDGKKLYTTAATDAVEARNLRRLLRALGIGEVQITRVDTTRARRQKAA